ncbi:MULTISPECIES: AIPR family protein [unclassified Streptomyces]|uniref:AIPR family protein n=1 Tax=unclassified Streptomyces TaxID=2593676 RepID=UPI0003769954|nr:MULTISPECIES: AIPR family protein [unclassified Streptomyces]MYT31713.1 abortive phage infection protein [Streptomyces sp. SID8354]
MSTPPRRPDVPTQVRQVANFLDSAYGDLIDMSDFGNRRPEDLVIARRSRALAAHAVRMVTDWTPAQSAACVIDGGGDQGIDAIAVDQDNAHIYLVQAKWSESGSAKADETAVLKLFSGLTLIDAGESRQFNPRGRVLADQAKELLGSDLTKVTQVIILMGTKELSPGVCQAIANGEKDFNHDGTHVFHRVIHSPEIYARARDDQRPEPITLEVTLSPWFACSPSDQQAYQGVVQAEQIVEWAAYGNRLFDHNIRNPLGVTPINSELVETLTEEPSNFWYFNNGITILCDSVEVEKGSKKQPERLPLRLTTHGASVVNGAQTVRAVIDAAKEDEDAELAEVGVRIIVTGGDTDFAKRTTQATNRQNHIEDRDRIALDPIQAVLIEEFRAELDLVYSVRRGDLEPQGDEGCSVVEAATALACAHSGSRFTARLVAADSTDVLWERGGGGIYDPLFRTVPGVFETWNAVRVLRETRRALRPVRDKYEKRGAAVIDDGSYLLTHLVFRQLLEEDAGIGEPDPSEADAAWFTRASRRIPELLARTVPVLLGVLDARHGTRSDLKRVCIDDAECAALVTDILLVLSAGGETRDVSQYLRKDERPRKPRRPNSVHVIVNQRALSEGAPLRLSLYVPAEQEALEAWLSADPTRSRATWTGNTGKALIWEYDRQRYSPSGLVSRMWELADWEGRPVSNQGTARWVTQDGETLAELAERLLGGLEGESGE